MESPAPGFERLGPAHAESPLVCAVSHAGRAYPAELLEAAAVPRRLLEDLEDRHADQLITGLVRMGAAAVVARTARAWIDLNRGEEDLDPALRIQAHPGGEVSARARSGLGLIPRRVGRQELWRIAPTRESVAERLAALHQPYHAAIARALAAARARFGFAVLLDCHSMPTLGPGRARLVIGDRHGASASRAIRDALVRTARAAGVPAACNEPYAGAYTVARHGRPAAHIHAVQIEIDRALYLAPDRRTVSDQLFAVRHLVTRLGEAAVAAAEPRAAAAE